MSFRVKAKTRHLAPNARKGLNPAGLVNISNLSGTANGMLFGGFRQKSERMSLHS